MLSQFLWTVGLLSVIAVGKALAIHFFREEEVKNHLNFCWCGSVPTPLEGQCSAPAAPGGDGGETERELILLRQRVRQLAAECADLRRKNTEQEQVLAYIRKVVFDAPGARPATGREGTP